MDHLDRGFYGYDPSEVFTNRPGYLSHVPASHEPDLRPVASNSREGSGPPTYADLSIKLLELSTNSRSSKRSNAPIGRPVR